MKKNKKAMNRNSTNTFSFGLATEVTVNSTKSIPQTSSIIPPVSVLILQRREVSIIDRGKLVNSLEWP